MKTNSETVRTPPKKIHEIEKEIIDEFNRLCNVDEKYAHLFQLGEGLPEMDPELKNNRNQVKGCQSNLWFYLYEEEGRVKLLADSDSMVIKGIAALLVRLINRCGVEQIEDISLDFIDQLKIWKLASERNNGLVAMLEHVQQRAKDLTIITNETEQGASTS